MLGTPLCVSVVLCCVVYLYRNSIKLYTRLYRQCIYKGRSV